MWFSMLQRMMLMMFSCMFSVKEMYSMNLLLLLMKK